MSPELTTKVEASTIVIRTALQRFTTPAVMCSFGKDSMAVLHLMRTINPDLPIIFHREPFQPHKYAYANRIIAEWDLTVYDFPPERTEVQEGGGEFEVMNYYPLGGGKNCALPTGFRMPLTGEKVVCGLREVYGKPTGTFNYPWNVVFHGHKNCDVDPVMGAVPLYADYALNVDCATAVFPLRTWTDADVWAYLEENKVPLHTDRYMKRTDGAWRERADKTHNPDYITACTSCMLSSNPRAVPCPKLGGQLVQNVSSQLRRAKLPAMSYTS